MRKWKIWLLIALGIPGSPASGALLNPNVWNATTTPVASATPGSATRQRAMNKVCRCDTSRHKVRFVTVEPGVHLEVLDWGGAGTTLVLLTGLGDNAHVFDQFAYQFNARRHRSPRQAEHTRGRICWALRCRNGTEQAWCSLSGSRQ